MFEFINDSKPKKKLNMITVKKAILSKVLAVVYIVIGVMTFGHYFNGSKFEKIDSKVLASFMVSATWPLYASVKFWEHKEVETSIPKTP